MRSVARARPEVRAALAGQSPHQVIATGPNDCAADRVKSALVHLSP
jgi:hypothetical protein